MSVGARNEDLGFQILGLVNSIIVTGVLMLFFCLLVL